MIVFIDADACPRAVTAIVREYQSHYGYEVKSVSSFNHVHTEPGHLTVGDEDQAADTALINLVRPGDVVITQDWGLGALALAKKAGAVSPDGHIFREETIGFLLEERALKARHRRGGGRTKGPAARTRADDERFRRAFTELMAKDPNPNA